MPSYVLPQVLVYQEFTRAPVAVTNPQNACIVGEQFDLHRYSDEDEKPGIKVSSTYDSTDETCYTWPGRQAGGVVDASYTKVFFDNALLKYFTDAAGADSDIFAVTPNKNRVRASSLVFKTANGYTRETELLRDVKAGDVARLTASVDGGPVTLQSTVIGLVADKSASVIGASADDVSNQAAVGVLTDDATQVEGLVNDVEAIADGTGYDGLETGDVAETYTVEVVTGGGENVAILRITSASGNDDVGLVTYDVPFGDEFAVGTRGLKVVWDTTGVGTDLPAGQFIVGQKWEIDVEMVFAQPADAASGTYVGAVDTTYIVEVTRGAVIGTVTGLTGSTTTGTGTILMADTTGIVVGMLVSGTGVGVGARVLSIVPATSIAVSEPSTATGGPVALTIGGEIPQITVSTTTGVDISGPTDILVSGTPVAVGTQGVLIAFTGSKMCGGDRYLIEVTAEADAQVRTLVLANNLPEELQTITAVCGTQTSTTVTCADTTGIFSGMTVSGTDIPAGTTVVSVVANTSFDISLAATGTTPGVTLTFAADMTLELYIKKNIQVPAERSAGVDNWTQSATELCMQAGVTGFDSEWVLNGVQQSLPVETAEIYVEHRDRVSTNCTTVGSISDVSDIADTFSTAPIVHPDNPLVFAVFKALENANGEEVRFLGVCSTIGGVALEDWLEALDKLVGRDDVYGLVPLTQDKDVQDAFVAHCDAESSPTSGRWRTCWLNRAATEVQAISTVIGVNPILATILDDPDTSGTQYTYVEATGATFLTDGVLAGDKVRALYTTDGFGTITYTEFTVDEVINEETIRLLTGPNAPINVASKIEIWRTLSRTAVATELATYPGLWANRRAKLVWPDQISNAGLTFPGYFLCAALAGLRSGVLPHQGLTNVELVGFDDVARTTEFFSSTQLNIMAASGYWIVTQDPNDGMIFTRHQLTTGDQTDVNQREDSVTSNIDNISYVFLNRLKTYIGRGNVTPTMIDILKGEIVSIIEEYKNNITVDRLGPQIIDASIVELRPHPTFKDRIVCRIALTLPAPFNNLELHLIVS